MGHQEADHGAAAAEAGDDDGRVGEAGARHRQAVGQRGEHRRGRALPVLVEDGDVQALVQQALHRKQRGAAMSLQADPLNTDEQSATASVIPAPLRAGRPAAGRRRCHAGGA